MDHEIIMRALLIAHRTGNLMHAATRASDCGEMSFADAAQRLPYLLGELANECDDALRTSDVIDAYLRGDDGSHANILELIAANARSATLPGESWVDVEAWATAQLGEVAA